MFQGKARKGAFSLDRALSQLMTSRSMPVGYPGWLFQYLNVSRLVVNGHCPKPLTTRTSLTSDQGTSRSLPQPQASCV